MAHKLQLIKYANQIIIHNFYDDDRVNHNNFLID